VVAVVTVFVVVIGLWLEWCCLELIVVTMTMVCAVTIVIVIAIVVVAITPLLNEKYRSCIGEVFTGNSFFSNYMVCE
jgi:hypothetical protein